MKKVNLILCFLLIIGCNITLAQRVENPAVESQAISTHNIYAVWCYKDKTRVFVEYAVSRFNSSSFSVSSKTTLTSKLNKSISLKIKEWGMYEWENDISLIREFDQQCSVDAGSYVYYYMDFDAIPLGLENISINENIAYGRYWNGIKIKNQVKVEDIDQRNAHRKRESNQGQQQPKQGNSVEDDDVWLGSASGFFISRQGYIATNYHVVEGVNKMQVEYYHDGKKHAYSAEVVITDQANDMAVIRINDEKFSGIKQIPYRLSLKAKEVGSDVFTLGYPLSFIMGEEIKYTRGEISARTGIQGDVRTYQISVPITNGNSGGPLFDYEGNIVGITSSGLNKQLNLAENVNYAIKSIYLQTLIESTQDNIILPIGQDLSGKTKPDIIAKMKSTNF